MKFFLSYLLIDEDEDGEMGQKKFTAWSTGYGVAHRADDN